VISSRSEEVLGGGSVLDALLERRRAWPRRRCRSWLCRRSWLRRCAWSAGGRT